MRALCFPESLESLLIVNLATPENLQMFCDTCDDSHLQSMVCQIPDYTQPPASALLEDEYYKLNSEDTQERIHAFYHGALAVLRLLGDTWGKPSIDTVNLGRELTHEARFAMEQKKREYGS